MACAFALTILAGGCADQAASGSGDGSGKSPLIEYLGDDHPFADGPRAMGALTIVAGGAGMVDSDASEKQLAQQREVEERIARCMRKQGFEYVPRPVERPEKSEYDKAYELPPDKFAEQYGYGISTLMWDDPAVGSGQNKDPNDAIRSKLSKQAKKAYDRALHGDGNMGMVMQSDGGAVAKAVRPGKPGKDEDAGCVGNAHDQVFGSGPDDFMEQQQKFDGLFEDLDALRQRIDADPRVQDAAEAWSNCMADKGHPGLKQPSEASEEVSQRMDDVLGMNPPGSESDSGPGTDEAEDPEEHQAPDPNQLDKVQEFELALAETDFECREEHYDEAYEKVKHEREQQFVDDHRNELERYRDWRAEQQRAGN